MGHDTNAVQDKAKQTMLWLYLTMQGALDDEGAVFIEMVALPDSNTVNFKVKVAPDELGKAIGKQGRTARALRTLLSARSGKDGVRYVLDLEANPVTGTTGAVEPKWEKKGGVITHDGGVTWLSVVAGTSGTLAPPMVHEPKSCSGCGQLTTNRTGGGKVMCVACAEEFLVPYED